MTTSLRSTSLRTFLHWLLAQVSRTKGELTNDTLLRSLARVKTLHCSWYLTKGANLQTMGFPAPTSVCPCPSHPRLVSFRRGLFGAPSLTVVFFSYAVFRLSLPALSLFLPAPKISVRVGEIPGIGTLLLNSRGFPGAS